MNLWTHTLGRGPDLVLLHGWGVNSDIWGHFAETLAASFRVTLIDLPGLGRSEALQDMTLPAVTAALLAAAPAGSAHWLGWSLGGQLALAVAEQAPGRMLSLSLIAANPCFVRRDDWPCGMAQSQFNAFAESLGQDLRKTLNRFALLQTRGSRAARAELKQLKTAMNPAGPEGLAAALQLLKSDLRPALAGLSCPAQLILGAEDPLVPRSLELQARVLNPQLDVKVLEQSAHLPFISHEEQVLNRVAALTRQEQTLG